MANYIIQVAALITASSVIIGALIGALVKLNALIKLFKKTAEHSDENYKAILRLTIMSHEMPIGERIIAGHKYLEAGGNGEVKKYLKEEFNITDTVDSAPHYKK
jgi:hypothetical protein